MNAENFNAPDLTIGIPVFNGGEALRNLLKSIAGELGSLNIQVVVVDDGKSSERCGEMVKEILPGNGEYYWDQSSYGLAKATDKIIEVMKGRYLLRLDADTLMNLEAVKKMVERMDKEKEIGVLGPRLVYLDNSFQPSYETHFKHPVEWFWDYFLWGKKIGAHILNRKHEQTLKHSFEVAYLASAVVIIRKTAIDKVGSVDSKMEFFMEDADWIWRIKEAGYKIIYWPEITCVHLGGHSGELYIHTRDRSIKNLYYFYNKHRPGLLNQTLLAGSILLGSAISLAVACATIPVLFINARFKRVYYRSIRSFVNVFRWHLLRLYRKE